MPASSPEVWDYIQSVEVAGRFDRDHADFPLFELDTRMTLGLLGELQAVRSSEPVRVLDLGCGTGRTLIAVAQAGAEAVGLDLSPHMLEKAAKNVAEAGVSDRVRLFRSDLASLRFLDEASVDLAVCLYGTLGLLRGQQARLDALRNVRRVLRPAGLLLVHVHNRTYPPHSPKHWLRLWRSWRAARRNPAEAEPGDFYFDDYAGAAVRRMFMHTFCRNELHDALDKAGYAVRTIHLIHPSRANLLENGLRNRLRSHGFFGVAVRP